MRLVVDELDALAQVPGVVHHRCLGDAERRVVGDGFDEQRKLELCGNMDALVAPQYGETGRGNAMVGKDLLRQRLVAGDHESAGIAARIRLSHQLEERDDVLVVAHDALEFLQQVERHVGLPVHDRAAQVSQVVAEAERPHVVA
jgi:hypothetical protein